MTAAEAPAPAPPPGEHHFRIAETAAKALGAMAEGNGLKAAQVRLVRQETVVHTLAGVVSVSLRHAIKTSDRAGRAAEGEALGGPQDIHSRIAAAGQALLREGGVAEALRAAIEADAGHGWAATDLKLRLPAGEKDYSCVETCPACHGRAAEQCQACNATGRMPCRTCAGQGQAACGACFGAGQLRQGDGSMRPCTQCQGSGRAPCAECAGARTVPCTQCRATGSIACAICASTGFRTKAWRVAFAAETAFRTDPRTAAPEALKLAEQLGQREMAAGGHAEISYGAFVAEGEGGTFPLTALLPVAQAEFSVDGKAVTAVVAGLKGRVFGLEPFLDARVKPGISALSKIARGAGAAGGLADMACKHRLVREALEAAARSKRAAYQKLAQDYPGALSDKYARACAFYAAGALQALGRGPRRRGLALGTLLSGALSGAWFFALRPAVAAAPQAWLPDGLVWGAGFLATFFMIRAFAARGAGQILSPAAARGAHSASAGREGIYAVFTTFIVWAGLALAAPDRPAWLAGLVTRALHP